MATKKVFSVYYNPQKKEEEIVVLEEKFSFLAFLFPFIYALKNNMKLFSVYFLFIQMIIFSVASKFTQVSSLISTIFSIFCGAFAADLYVFHLKRQGYKLKDIVYAETELDAEIIFYSRIRAVSNLGIV